MKAKKLAEMLLKHPDHDVVISDGDTGEYYNVSSDLDIRIGAVVLSVTGSEIDTNSREFFFIFDKKSALKELKELVVVDLNPDEQKEFAQDYGFISVKELMKKAETDEKLLRRIAKTYFFMA